MSHHSYNKLCVCFTFVYTCSNLKNDKIIEQPPIEHLVCRSCLQFTWQTEKPIDVLFTEVRLYCAVLDKYSSTHRWPILVFVTSHNKQFALALAYFYSFSIMNSRTKQMINLENSNAVYMNEKRNKRRKQQSQSGRRSRSRQVKSEIIQFIPFHTLSWHNLLFIVLKQKQGKIVDNFKTCISRTKNQVVNWVFLCR